MLKPRKAVKKLCLNYFRTPAAAKHPNKYFGTDCNFLYNNDCTWLYNNDCNWLYNIDCNWLYIIDCNWLYNIDHVDFFSGWFLETSSSRLSVPHWKGVSLGLKNNKSSCCCATFHFLMVLLSNWSEVWLCPTRSPKWSEPKVEPGSLTVEVASTFRPAVSSRCWSWWHGTESILMAIFCFRHNFLW